MHVSFCSFASFVMSTFAFFYYTIDRLIFCALWQVPLSKRG